VGNFSYLFIYSCIVIARFAPRTIQLELAWDVVGPRPAGQMATLPEFDGVFRSVRRAFRQAGIGAG